MRGFEIHSSKLNFKAPEAVPFPFYLHSQFEFSNLHYFPSKDKYYFPPFCNFLFMSEFTIANCLKQYQPKSRFTWKLEINHLNEIT